MKSLRGELMKWLLGALSLGSLVLVMVAYVVTLGEMNEVLDENLREVADSVAQFHAGTQLLTGSLVARPVEATSDDADLVTTIWRHDKSLVFSSNPRFAMLYSDAPGAARTTVAGEEWRTYTVLLKDAIVQAAQRTTARHQMAVESASKLFIPLVFLIMLMGGLLAVALRRGLRPWQDATTQIAKRSALSLEPIESGQVPQEIQPLVSAFNGLMQRLSNAFAMQGRFVADAAHELRSPITALRLQLTLLGRAATPEQRAEALAELQQGVARAERLVEQLLELSRAEPDAALASVEPIRLDALVRSVVSESNWEAVHRGIDLGASAALPAEVLGNPLQLRIALNNLVRNALRYSPRGSRVDVIVDVDAGAPVLRVIDNGPGIDAAERPNVGSPRFQCNK